MISKTKQKIANKYILSFCEIPNFINLDILKKFVQEDLENNIEYFEDLDITYKISDPKKAEWILSKSIDKSKLVGNGNTNIDINIDGKIGIDVSVLTLNNNFTNEKSIMQNFSNTGELDLLFNGKEGEKAVEIFKNKLIDKYTSNLDDIYYIIFICKKKNIYISCLKLNPCSIKNMKFAEFTKSYKNIAINNFINKKFGNVRLYKSKKRLELRLSKDIINHKHSAKIY